MKTLLLVGAPCLFFVAAAFSQADTSKFDSALAAKIREFKADPSSGESHISVIIQHPSPLPEDELLKMLAPVKGKLKRRITSLNMSIVELPIKHLESLAAEPNVKRISMDSVVNPGRR